MKPRLPAALLAQLALALLAAAPAAGGSFVVFEDDRAAFTAALHHNPLSTVVDTGGAFAPDPPGSLGVASVVRSGSVAGAPITYSLHDVDFQEGGPGTLTPVVAGGDLAGVGTFDVELPARQGRATGLGSWGVDSGGGSPATRNALLADFSATPGAGLGHFALDLIDFEASAAFTPGELRLYSAGVLVFSHAFSLGPSGGNDAVHFLGVVGLDDSATFDQALVVLGDDSGGLGLSERWAADRFTFGRAVVNPEPSTYGLFGTGLVLLALWLRRRRKAREACAAAAAVESPS